MGGHQSTHYSTFQEFQIRQRDKAHTAEQPEFQVKSEINPPGKAGRELIRSFAAPETFTEPLLSEVLGSRNDKAQSLLSGTSQAGGRGQRNRNFQLSVVELW